MMFGKRRGFSRLFGRGVEMSREDKISYLKDYKKALVEELEDVEQALNNPDSS